MNLKVNKFCSSISDDGKKLLRGEITEQKIRTAANGKFNRDVNKDVTIWIQLAIKHFKSSGGPLRQLARNYQASQ